MVMLAMSAGCLTRAHSGMASVELHIIAKPKTGVTEKFVHVAVYDAAPAPVVPTGEYEHVDYSNLSDIVVWLEPVEKQPTATASPLVLSIDPAKPSNKIHAAAVGQRIVFRNRSAQTVSLYSVSDGNDFELAPIAAGATGEYVTQNQGLIEILADPAKAPIAQVYAAPSRFVARAHSGQTITFDSVPPGEYQAMSWHPRLPCGSTSVNVAAGKISRSTLTVGVNELSLAKTP